MAKAIINRVWRGLLAPSLRRITRAVLSACVALPLAQPVIAQADDWGCQVLLCLSDPRGPEAEGACVPPIEKLWTALRHGDPFPTCDLNSSVADLPPQIRSAIPASTLASLGNGTGAANVGASANYCRPNLLFWGGPEQSELLCGATGAINVNIDGKLWSRVWWNTTQGATVSEYYGDGTTPTYDPATAQQQFLQLQNQQNSASGGQGG
jgi:hypothetical protein